MNIYQKLLKIQQSVMGLGKDRDTKSQYNPNGYAYVTGTKVLEHIKPLMNEFGLLLKQEVLSIDNSRQDYAVKSGMKSEILSKVMMRFTWIDCETGEKDENLFGANGQNDWEKGAGSALTYAERYFLLKFFHIATDEDDIDNPDRKPEQESATGETSPVNSIEAHAEALNKCDSLTDMTLYYNKLTEKEKASKDIIKIFTDRKNQLKKSA